MCASVALLLGFVGEYESHRLKRFSATSAETLSLAPIKTFIFL